MSRSSKSADFGMTNPGGLRTDLLVDDVFGGEEPGEATVGELNAVLPFANDHGVVALAGADVIRLVEEQWQPDGASRSFLHMGISRRARRRLRAPTRSAASTSVSVEFER